MKTYFLRMGTVSICDSDSCGPTAAESEVLDIDDDACRLERLVDWNVEVLSDLLKQIVARNQNKGKRRSALQTETSLLGRTSVLKEVKEVIKLPEFDAAMVTSSIDPNTIKLDNDVIKQLRHLIAKIGSLYKYVQRF